MIGDTRAEKGGRLIERLEPRRLLATVFSNADFAGILAFASETESGHLKANGAQEIPQGEIEDAIAGSTLDGNYTVQENGTVTVSYIRSGDQQLFRGWFNAGKDIVFGGVGDVLGDPSTFRLAAIVKHSVRYSSADLAGAWNFYGLKTNGTLLIGAAGDVLGGTINELESGVKAVTGGRV